MCIYFRNILNIGYFKVYSWKFWEKWIYKYIECVYKRKVENKFLEYYNIYLVVLIGK